MKFDVRETFLDTLSESLGRQASSGISLPGPGRGPSIFPLRIRQIRQLARPRSAPPILSNNAQWAFLR